MKHNIYKIACIISAVIILFAFTTLVMFSLAFEELTNEHTNLQNENLRLQKQITLVTHENQVCHQRLEESNNLGSWVSLLSLFV